MADTTKTGKGHPAPMTPEQKKAFQKSFNRYNDYISGGGKGIWNGFAALDAAMGVGSKKETPTEDPVTPPPDGNDDGSGGGTTSTSGKPKSNSWPDIVSFYFPEGARTQYKAGGLVRGGGAATKGRGRGRIV